MCRWIAYRGDPIFLEDLIHAPSNSLIDQSLDCREGARRTNGDGFGMGWYGTRSEPGLFRDVLPAWNDQNLRALSQQIQSPLFFAHVRASTGTETSRLNCHPFAYDRWLFMHNGEIGGYRGCRRQLETLLSDGLYRHRQGTTDSELFFLLMIQNGLEDDPVAAIRATIRQITGVAADHGTEEPFVLTICVTDGNRLYTCRHASAGIPPTLYLQGDERDVLIASEPLDDGQTAWREIDANSIVVIDESVTIRPLFEDGKAGGGRGRASRSGTNDRAA